MIRLESHNLFFKTQKLQHSNFLSTIAKSFRIGYEIQAAAVRSFLGRVIFVVGYPGLFLILNGSRRTRVVIEYGGRILLLRQTLSLGEWSLPGGGIHRGEDSTVAAIREVKEELGIELNLSDMKLVVSKTVSSHFMKIKADFYHAKLDLSPNIKLQQLEILESRWFDRDELVKIKMNVDEKETLLKL